MVGGQDTAGVHGPTEAPARRAARPALAPATEALAGRLAAQTARLEALQEITAALAAMRAPEDVVAAVMPVMARALGAHLGGLCLLSADGTRLDWLPAPDFEPAPSHPLLLDPLSLPSPYADAVRGGEAVWVGTFEEGRARYPDLGGLGVAYGVQAVCSLPLRLEGRIIGCLTFSFARPRAFPAEERAFLQAIAGLTAQAVERARLYLAEQERARSAEELARLHAATAEALRRSEQQFRLLAEHSTDVIERYTPDMRLLYASPAIRQLLGFKPEEIVGRYSFEFVHPDDRAATAAARRPVQTEGAIGRATYRCLRADGTYIWVESIGRAIRDESSGEIVEIQVTTRDIGERKRAEDALRALAGERQEQAALAEALAEAGAALAMALEPERLHAIILEQMARVIPCDCAYILAYCDGWVIVAAGYGEPRVPAGRKLMPVSPAAAGLA